MHGFWPDVLRKSKCKTAFNEAMACNISISNDELLFHLVWLTPFSSSCIRIWWHCSVTTSICLLLSSTYPQEFVTLETWLLRTVLTTCSVLIKAHLTLKHMIFLLDLLAADDSSNPQFMTLSLLEVFHLKHTAVPE